MSICKLGMQCVCVDRAPANRAVCSNWVAPRIAEPLSDVQKIVAAIDRNTNVLERILALWKEES